MKRLTERSKQRTFPLRIHMVAHSGIQTAESSGQRRSVSASAGVSGTGNSNTSANNSFSEGIDNNTGNNSHTSGNDFSRTSTIGKENVFYNVADLPHAQNEKQGDSSRHATREVQTTMSSLPSYPFFDTFSFLCILMVLPHWLSSIALILYVFLGYPDFLESVLSLFLKHKFNRNHTTANLGYASLSHQSTTQSSFSLAMFLTQLIFDMVLIYLLYQAMPTAVPYAILLGKAFMASNLTSLRSRYILDAFLASSLLVILEYFMLFAITHFEIFRGDSLISLTSLFSPVDSEYPPYYRTDSSFSKLLLFHLSFHKIPQNSEFMYNLERAIKFAHSTLSLYIIMHNINPILRRFTLIDRVYSFLEMYISPDQSYEIDGATKITTSSQNMEPSSSSSNTIPTDPNPFFQNNSNRPKSRNVFQIPKEISRSSLPTLSAKKDLYDDFGISTVEDNENSDDTDKEEGDTTTTEKINGSDRSDESIPMFFPEDHQILNMNDVSSSSYVVAENFETLCRMIWSQNPYSSKPSTVSCLTQSSPQMDTSNSSVPTAPPPSSSSSSKHKSNGFHINHVNNNISRKLPNKLKSTPSEKRSRISSLRMQQPLWTLLNAARTMFSRLDYYSGDYYSQNAIVTTGNGMNDYARNNGSSSQCFIWFTGETTLAFELHNISLEQLLIKVNGIIWEHVSSCAFFGREMIIINGLSPLSQYDIDFVKITLNGELIHLTTTTVSTIFENKTVTESTTSSPLATLQRSVVTTQEAIEREKARLKKLKSDWRKKSSQMKTDIENLNNRNNPSDESRNYKKLDSLRQTVVKSEKEIATLSKKAEEVRLLQTEVEEKHLDVKRLHETELRYYKQCREDYESSIAKNEEHIKSLRNEKAQLLSKKEKTATKKLRVHNEVELLNAELESMKKTEIALRIESRKFRSIQREEKYKLLVRDIQNFEKQLRSKSLGAY